MIITSDTLISIEEDFKVEAGPGAGKTEFLINHIKNVLQSSTRMACTRQIACITYTNTAVETILKRLGKNVSSRVDVSTIHSFLYKHIVKPYCSLIPNEYEVDCKKVNGHEDFFVSNKYIREWFENEDFSILKHPNTQNQLLRLPVLNKALQNWLSSMKCVYEDGDILFKCDNKKAVSTDKKTGGTTGIKATNLKILSENIIGLKKIYWRKGRLDHNDILYFSYILINKHPFVLEVIRAKFPYMFIDEYQDTNPIQSFVIDKIREKETKIGVIGDKAQSIYMFQGAQPSLFNMFEVETDNTFTICDNHRSTNQIIRFLNSIRDDICQKSCKNIDDRDITIYIGDRNIAYKKACEVCDKPVISLSRDNITSNAMKKEIEGDSLNRNLLEQLNSSDSNSGRRNFISSYIKAIELAKNSKYKEAIKNIEWIYRSEEKSKKIALSSLLKMVNVYDYYSDGSLMTFYDVICDTLEVKLSKFRAGAARDFYSNNQYKDIAICINIIEDTSNHITVHKSKGSEFENVFAINNDFKDFLLAPDLENNEEHRIMYVAISRAKRKLFLLISELDESNKKKIEQKYKHLDIQYCN